MGRAAFIARLCAAAISLLYMLVLMPHFAGVTAEHFSSGWFLGGMLIAFAWLPLLFLNHRFEQGSGTAHTLLSFAPLAFIVAFFGALFAVA